MSKARIRLYVDQPLGEGQSVPLSRAQAHYLFAVMRRRAGDALVIFNNTDGTFRARVSRADKRHGELACATKMRDVQMPPDLWLAFAPVKKARTDYIVEKACEMGVARILPVRTEFTGSERIRQDRLQAHAIEAAEQCGAGYVPEVTGMTRLDTLLANWPAERRILFCNEAATAAADSVLARAAPGPWAVLIGPQGGFSQAERDAINAMQQTAEVSLGPRILRADTAAVAALTLWQMALGDWRPAPR